ncbi:hypothetical protein [Mycobacterium sp. PSTR-4-N]|uniref:hypothetical protein n=1 Tax=Mycobacterium sp. PSTR-4-N TaxID=2917745 RepID=UPI001F14AE13|nr:hypothetical protein [Mycobacterium sp. PSTR-4-N]MCG7592413.1 hypothetical protein [Mycobacterium sp. PSTR-4-N]
MTDHLAEAQRLARRGGGGDFGRVKDLSQAVLHLVDAISEQPATTPAGSDDPGPWHIVSRSTGRHHGPFSTEHDAAMARALAAHIAVEWHRAAVLNREDFDCHLERSNVGGVLS